jgi:hypothetical protein
MNVVDRLEQARALHEQQEQEHEAYRIEADILRIRRRTQRDVFLKQSEAVATPPEWYAAWLYLWLRDGGDIAYTRDRNLMNQNYWTPRRQFGIIPTGYGALSVTVLLIESLTPGHTLPSPCHYGHNKLLWMDLAGKGEARVLTPLLHVESFLDVEQLIRDRGKRLIEDVRESVLLRQ